MSTATLQKWGNGQGVYIPRSACEELGITVGDKLEFSVVDGGIRLVPEPRGRRTRKVSATELFKGYRGGAYEIPDDLPSSGHEVDWGAPVGNEVW